MSQTIAPQHPFAPLRRTLARLWDEPDTRSVLIGLLGMLLVHLLLLLFAPYILRVDPRHSVLRPHASSRQFTIQIAPDTFAPKAPPKPPPPFKFVEANPDAPDNVPDKTNNFSSQNQQVAQEKPTPNGKSDMPALEGRKDFQSTQIVSGQLTKPVELAQTAPPVVTPPVEAAVTTPRLEQNPLPGFEKKTGESQESIGTNIAKFAEAPKNVSEEVEGVKDVPLIEGATATTPHIDPLNPMPRRQLVKEQVRPGVFAENKFGTSNIGPTAVDAKWSQYGEYLRRMIDTVQTQWDRIMIQSQTYPPSGSTVQVKFIMDSEGKIARIVNVDNKATEQAARACMSSITERAPYGKWTDDMIAVLGQSQEMTFTFYYQ